MPSLSDSLSALADYSAQIHKLSASNLSPSGPYTTAYLDSLHLNPTPHPSSSSASRKRSRASNRDDTAGVLNLIRDAQESEVRLFRFIGEAEVAGVGRVKRVEKRDEARGSGAGGSAMSGVEGRDEVEVMLRTALRLVDDYRPMPRARATIASLLETHHNHLKRVAELELKIEEASTAPPTSVSKAPSQPSSPKPKSKDPKLTFEETIKAEELALRRMESDLIPLRANRLASSSAPDPAFESKSSLPSSPSTISSRLPAKTPSANRNITNSLVNGATPRRPMSGTTPGGPGGVLTEGFEFDRFSPLKFLGTPRAGGRARSTKSTLREVMGSPTAEATVGRGIFGRRGTGAGLGSSVGPSRDASLQAGKTEETRVDIEQEGEVEDEDQTMRFIPASVSSAGQDEPEPEPEPGLPSNVVQQPLPVESAEQPIHKEPEGVLEGIQVKLPIVAQAISKIREGLPEMLRQGLLPGSDQPESTEETIIHLARISRSDPSDPPSPSSHSTSTLSSNPSAISGPPVPPITPQTILTAHLLLALLRGDEGAVSMSDLKDDLGAVARARGWESSGAEAVPTAAGGMVTKCIYHVVGKRVVKIDRKAGGRVMFAI